MVKKYLLILFCLFLIISIYVFFRNNNLNKNWTFYVANKIGSKTYTGNNLFFDQKYLYFSDQNDKIYCLDKKTGSQVWTFEKHSYTPYGIIQNDYLFVSNFDSHIYSLAKQNGYPRWSFAIPEGILPDTGPISDNNDKNLFFADRAGILYAINKENGSPVWTKNFKTIDDKLYFKDGTIHFGKITQDDNFLYIKNSPEGKFYVVDKVAGNELYQTSTDNLLPPLLFNNLIIVPTIYNSYIALEKPQFNEKWRLIGGTVRDLNLYTGKDTSSLITDNGLTLRRLNITDKNIIWSNYYGSKYKAGLIDTQNGQVVIEKPDYLHFKTKIEILDWNNGKINWSFDISGQIKSFNLNNNRLFVSLNSNKIFIFDILTGKLLREFVAQGPTLYVADFNKQFLIVTSDQKSNAVIYYLDKNNLDLLWKYKTDYSIDPAEIYKDNDRLYFIDKNKNLIQTIKPDIKFNFLTTKKNYIFIENFGKVVPGQDFREQTSLSETIKRFVWSMWDKLNYLVKNYQNIYKFDIYSEPIEGDFYQLTLKNDQNLYKNYYTDVKIKAEFNNSNNKPIIVEGYYYDFNTWKINFAPSNTGKWKWKVSVRTPYTTYIKRGSFVINEKPKHTFLTITGDNFIDKGKVFIPLGLQDVVSDKNLNGNPLDQMGKAVYPQPAVNKSDYRYISFKDYIKMYKVEAGLNTFRVNLDNNGPSILKNLNWKNFEINTNDAKFTDNMLSELIKDDYKIVFSLFGFNPPFQDSKKTFQKEKVREVRKYLDYMVARYGPYIDIWEISNEASLSENWLNNISTYIRKIDPYHHPITVNWEQKKLENSELLSIHWYSSARSNLNSMEDQIYQIGQTVSDWNKAVLISEYGFKDLSYFADSADYMRIFTWLSVFNKMGLIYWNQPLGVYKNPDNANIYLGPIERKLVRNLINFIPDITTPLKTEKQKDLSDLNLYQLRNDKYILGYLINRSGSCKYNTTMSLRIDKDAIVEWYDVINGSVFKSYSIGADTNKLSIPKICKDLAFKITYSPLLY